MANRNRITVYINMIGILLIVIVGLALTKPLNTGSFVVGLQITWHVLLLTHYCTKFGEFYNGSGFGNNGYAFLLVILQSQYTLSSYDGAAHMAEGMLIKMTSIQSMSNRMIFRNQKLATWLAIWYSYSCVGQCYYRFSLFGCRELYGEGLWSSNLEWWGN